MSNPRPVYFDLALSPTLKLSDRHMVEAMKASRLSLRSDGKGMTAEEGLAHLNEGLASLIVAAYAPDTGETRRVGQSLEEIASFCRRTIDCFKPGLDPSTFPLSGDGKLGLALTSSLDPVIVAALGGAAADGVDNPGEMVGATLESLSRLGNYCEAAAKQLFIGSEVRSRALKKMASKSVAEEYAWEVMYVYEEVTGEEIGFTRVTTGDDEGAVTGPLIDFIQCIFEITRLMIKNDARYATGTAAVNLEPARGTITTWISRRRKLVRS